MASNRNTADIGSPEGDFTRKELGKMDSSSAEQISQ